MRSPLGRETPELAVKAAEEIAGEEVGMQVEAARSEDVAQNEATGAVQDGDVRAPSVAVPAVVGEQDQDQDEDEDELASSDDDSDAGETSLDAGSSADYEVSLAASPFAKPAHPQLATPRGAGASNEKENAAPTGNATPGEEADDAEYAEADEFGLDKSMVIRSGSKNKKTKRCGYSSSSSRTSLRPLSSPDPLPLPHARSKLGAKVHDVDDLDTFEGVLSPIRKTPSAAGRSFLQR